MVKATVHASRAIGVYCVERGKESAKEQGMRAAMAMMLLMAKRKSPVVVSESL